MLIKDLIGLLLAHNPSAEAYFMTQRKQPFENHIAGVVARSQMADQAGREEDGIAPDDVFLTVGKRIRPGSLSAWILSERAEREGVAPRPARECEEVIDAIAAEYLYVDSLTPPAGVDNCPPHFLREDVHEALIAAYHAGIAKMFQPGQQPSSNDHGTGANNSGGRSTHRVFQIGDQVMSRVTQYGLHEGDFGTVEGLREVRTPSGIATTVTVQFGDRRVIVHNPDQVLALAHIDAHGVQGLLRTPWRIRFGDTSEMEVWCRNNEATVLGQRLVDASDPEDQ